MTKLTSTLWPKPYILQVYRRAIEAGVVRVGPFPTEADYKSFASAFYRIRRRVDAQHDQFIEPSFHLCTLTWEPETRHAIVTYDKLPDGMTLPEISDVDAQSFPSSTAPRQTHALPPPVAASEDEIPDENFDSEAHVKNILEQVRARIESNGDEKGEIE